MRSKVLFASVLFVFVAGCAAHHINKGDSYAATGDWKSAEAEYRTALASKPNEPGLKEKHDHAAQEAVKQAKANAQNCLTSRNFGCAVGEADYAANMAPGDGEAQGLKQEARKEYALDDCQKAQAQASVNPDYTFQLLDHARSLSQAPEVASAIQAAQGAAVTAAVNQANGLQAQAEKMQGAPALPVFDKGIAVLDHAARYDPRVAANAQAMRQEKDRWAAGEYERIARQGDDAAAHRDWNNAIAQYNAAEQVKPGGRARPMIAYAQLCMQGDQTFAQKNFKASLDAYTRASQMPEDRTHYAAGQIQAVNQAITAEYNRLLGMGDQALSTHGWAAAITQYQQAEALRAGGPAQPRIAYAQLCEKGDAAIGAKDWKTASTVYQQAANMPFDRDHYAATQADRVVIRPYLVRVHSLVVKPVRPDGEPWMGPPSVQLQQAMQAMIAANGGINWHAISRIPPANIPWVDVEFALPNGHHYHAPSRQGINPLFDAGMVFECNAFDDRAITLSVRYAPPNAAPEVMDTMVVKLQDVLQQKPMPAGGSTVLALELAAEPAHGQTEGAVTGGLVDETPTNPAPPPPAPAPAPHH